MHLNGEVENHFWSINYRSSATSFDNFFSIEDFICLCDRRMNTSKVFRSTSNIHPNPMIDVREATMVIVDGNNQSRRTRTRASSFRTPGNSEISSTHLEILTNDFSFNPNTSPSQTIPCLGFNIHVIDLIGIEPIINDIRQSTIDENNALISVAITKTISGRIIPGRRSDFGFSNVFHNEDSLISSLKNGNIILPKKSFKTFCLPILMKRIIKSPHCVRCLYNGFGGIKGS